jgi:hypothetical protein
MASDISDHHKLSLFDRLIMEGTHHGNVKRILRELCVHLQCILPTLVYQDRWQQTLLQISGDMETLPNNLAVNRTVFSMFNMVKHA